MKIRNRTKEKWPSLWEDREFSIEFKAADLRCTIARHIYPSQSFFSARASGRKWGVTSCVTGTLKECMAYLRRSISKGWPEGCNYQEGSYSSDNISFGSHDEHREYLNLLPYGYDTQIRRATDAAVKKGTGQWM